MSVIKENTWDKVKVHTWDDLSNNKWMDFRLALMEHGFDLDAQGVAVEKSSVTNEFDFNMNAQGVAIEKTSSVMEFDFEMIVNTVVSNRDYFAKMISYLPLYERKSVIFNELLKAYDRRFRKSEQEIIITERNQFIDTAVELLWLYERDLGIESIKRLHYDQRREQIMSRYRASFDQTTEETIKVVASAYSNGEVEVNKTDIEGVFEIEFVGTVGIPDNMEGLKQALDIIIPAHLGLTYEFIFNTWDDVSNMTWQSASLMTWDELRDNKGVRSS